MSDNPGAKDHHEVPVSETSLRWPIDSSGSMGPNDQMMPEVAGYKNPGPTTNLRGVEFNTNESKGVAYDRPPPTGEPHGAGESCAIEEST